ncbi:MAG: hypothetical protein U0Q16_12405 [Bryobacteraceae bacterium]
MATVRVHVTLDDITTADPEAMLKKVAQIERLAGIEQTDQKRLIKYGILTGMVDDSKLDAIRAVRGVLAVETDQSSPGTGG